MILLSPDAVMDIERLRAFSIREPGRVVGEAVTGLFIDGERRITPSAPNRPHGEERACFARVSKDECSAATEYSRNGDG
jgi:hypothetical protein